MNCEAKKIINWAASQSNGHGGHISAISDVIESGNVSGNTLSQIKAAKHAWIKEHNNRFTKK